MVNATRRAGLTDSTLVRLLSRLGDKDVADSSEPFAQRLAGWFGWADAIPLSGALAPRPVAAAADAPDPHRPQIPRNAPDMPRHDACAALRSVQADQIADDIRRIAADGAVDPLAWRRHYTARQHAMGTAIGALRSRLRAGLSACSPALARLAALDAVMEPVLGAREADLLSAVPGLLAQHAEAARQAAATTAATAADAGEADDPALAATFARELHDVLLAELDLRLQPLEGLAAALRTSPAPNRTHTERTTRNVHTAHPS